MGLRGIEATLPPGFRFYPNDEELVFHYLYKKVANERLSHGTMVEVDLHTCEPWQLPDVAKLGTNEWYFFSFRDRKYATGMRANRATTSGYWKATGKDRPVLDPTTQAIMGMRKTLVFYRERAPNGIKTGWVMHEFRIEKPNMPPKEDWVLCRVFHKNKAGSSPNFRAEFEQENIGRSSLNLETSPPNTTHRSIENEYEQMTSFSNIPYQEGEKTLSNTINLALLHCDFLGFPQDVENATIIDGMSSSGGDDDYGFLLDMGLEGRDLGMSGPVDLHETRSGDTKRRRFL